MENKRSREETGVYARLRKITSIAFVVAMVVASLTLYGCGGEGSASESGGGGSTTLSLVGYSTIEEAYDELTPAFAETKAGKGVTFTSSYGPSGDQSRAVEALVVDRAEVPAHEARDLGPVGQL